jgi:hypothetical protein
MRAGCAIALLLVACGIEAPTATSELSSPGSSASSSAKGATRKLALSAEQSHYLTVQRSADGTLRTRCVQGHAHAQRSLGAAAPSTGFSLPPGPRESAP